MQDVQTPLHPYPRELERSDPHAGWAQERAALLARVAELEEEVAGLRVALQTRNLIGQAQGLLIEQYGVDADAAFQTLVRLSQHSHLKLRDVAQRLVAAAIREQGNRCSSPASAQHPPTPAAPRPTPPGVAPIRARAVVAAPPGEGLSVGG